MTIQTNDGDDAAGGGQTRAEKPAHPAARRGAGRPPGAGAGKPVRRPGPVAWDEARRDHETNGVSFNEIADRLGVTRKAVAQRARDDGWLAGSDARAILIAGDPRRMRQLVNRLYRAFDVEIGRLEKRLGLNAGEAPPEPVEGVDAVSEAEKTARTLSSLARTLDTLIELRSSLPEAEEDSGKGADDLRQELAERLERIRRDG
ncbi:hypothetical protein HPQ64_17040 [Rhizobiales bacterium]|uniref:hypothetical protein n=1 Tax=Hongsoonwoonella zoysiae TaxID=2821844 RepID=UPI00155F8256|nr:hypothetical protein [Hongsoonwoonella zoysiae]NRG19401.1 hypothetical protein [Hongsoonwoonella zoysiae]